MNQFWCWTAAWAPRSEPIASSERFPWRAVLRTGHAIKGNNMLVLSKPQVIADIHNAYFEAGLRISLKPNTFNSTIAMADCRWNPLSAEINYERRSSPRL